MRLYVRSASRPPFRDLLLTRPFLPSSQYADLWAKLGAKYSGQARVSFSLRNSVSGGTVKWAAACQAAVKSIRASGCTTQKIALGLGGGGLIETLLGTWGSAMRAFALLPPPLSFDLR